MTGGRMAEPRLGPEELDRLEDALEGLEFLEDLHDPSSSVSRRLADFQAILQASREALPLEEVPPGLLDGVLAEARMSAEDTSTRVEAPKGQSLWSRLRKAWLIPALAVAGSATLVLILLQPAMENPEPAVESGSVAMNEAPAQASPVAAEPTEAAAPKSRAQGTRAPQPAPPPAKQETQEPAAPADTTIPTVTAGATATAPVPEPKVEPEPDPKLKKDASDDGWNAVEEGDRARKGGDCFSARNHYARALDDGNDSVRARAYVGLGLCKREDGNEPAAEEFFRQARELDEDAVDFAKTQEKARPKPRRRSRKKASGNKKNSPIDFDEAFDPTERK